MDDIAEHYRTLDTKSYISLQDSIALSKLLAERCRELPHDFDLVVGIANGALLPTVLVSENLSLPYKMITIRRKGSILKGKISKSPFLLKFFSKWFELPILNVPLRWGMRKMRDLAPIDPSGFDNLSGKERVLLIDDALEFGTTIHAAKEYLIQRGVSNIEVAVISWAELLPGEEQLEKPDIHLCRIIHHFPWSINSPSYNDYCSWIETNVEAKK